MIAVFPVPRRPTKKHFDLSKSSAARMAGVSTNTLLFSSTLSYSANDWPSVSFFRDPLGNLAVFATFAKIVLRSNGAKVTGDA